VCAGSLLLSCRSSDDANGDQAPEAFNLPSSAFAPVSRRKHVPALPSHPSSDNRKGGKKRVWPRRKSKDSKRLLYHVLVRLGEFKMHVVRSEWMQETESATQEARVMQADTNHGLLVVGCGLRVHHRPPADPLVAGPPFSEGGFPMRHRILPRPGRLDRAKHETAESRESRATSTTHLDSHRNTERLATELERASGARIPY
jgi:hypothetical protein